MHPLFSLSGLEVAVGPPRSFLIFFLFYLFLFILIIVGFCDCIIPSLTEIFIWAIFISMSSSLLLIVSLSTGLICFHRCNSFFFFSWGIRILIVPIFFSALFIVFHWSTFLYSVHLVLRHLLSYWKFSQFWWLLASVHILERGIKMCEKSGCVNSVCHPVGSPIKENFDKNISPNDFQGKESPVQYQKFMQWKFCLWKSDWIDAEGND